MYTSFFASATAPPPSPPSSQPSSPRQQSPEHEQSPEQQPLPPQTPPQTTPVQHAAIDRSDGRPSLDFSAANSPAAFTSAANSPSFTSAANSPSFFDPEPTCIGAAKNITTRKGARESSMNMSLGGGEGRNMSLGGEGRLLQLESDNANLKHENAALRMQVAGLEALPRRRRSSVSIGGPPARTTRRRQHKLRDSYMHTLEDDDAAGNAGPAVSKGKISRQASIGTARVLSEIPATPRTPASRELPKKVVDVFREPLRVEHTTYLASRRFALDAIELSRRASAIFESESRVLKLESPCYVFGDTHGNLEDLHYFSDHIWRLGVSLTAGSLLFLGDYVDRGLSSLEVVSYLFALKILEPTKVWLLRGNHETRDVNGWKEHYGDRSFLYQCERRFGEDLGLDVWEAINSAFDRLPLAATIDDEIFCIHGGFPRKPGEVPEEHKGLTRLQLLDKVPKVITINPPDPRADPHLQQMASECIWSDPAHAEQEVGLDETGFGRSLRGGGTVCFGQLAIRAFLQETGCAFIIRAHEAHAHGVSLSKSATVFTVFSTSKDHHQGKHASCGCMLVDIDKIQIINRSPSYRNRYVHRRDSVSLMGLGHAEIQRRQDIGLVIEADDYEADDYDDYNDEDDDLELQEVQEEQEEEEQEDDDEDLRGYSSTTQEELL